MQNNGGGIEKWSQGEGSTKSEELLGRVREAFAIMPRHAGLKDIQNAVVLKGVHHAAGNGAVGLFALSEPSL